MNRFREGYFAIFRGKEFHLDKSGYYGWGLDGKESDKNLGFKPGQNYSPFHFGFVLPITPDQVESAYRLETWARYKGYDFFVRGYDKENDTYGLSIPWEMSKEIVLHLFGIIRRSGHDDDTPFFKDVEFEDIWELRTPIEGFRFVGPEKVYLKKDGVWLNEVL